MVYTLVCVRFHVFPEANMSAARELDGDEQDDLVSAPRMVLQQFVAKHMFKGIGPHTLSTNDMNKLLTQVRTD